MTQIKLHTWGAGPPILLLHAFPLNAGMWEPQVQALSASATLVAPDLPGFGDSAEAPSFDSLDSLAGTLYDMLRALGIEQTVVAGCSMGGYLAFALLRAAPNFVTRLALLNTKPTRDSEQARANRLALAERVEREGCAFLVEEWDRGALSPVTLASKPAVVDCVRALIQEATPRGVAAAQRAMANRPDSSALLPQIGIPTLVLHGLDDRIISEQEARAMADAIKGAQFVGIPDAAHLPNLERPEIVSETLARFFPSQGRSLGHRSSPQ